jgi:hypothetical protein
MRICDATAFWGSDAAEFSRLVQRRDAGPVRAQVRIIE